MSTKKWVLFFLLSPLYFWIHVAAIFLLLPVILPLCYLIGYLHPELMSEYDIAIFFVAYLTIPAPFVTYVYAKLFGLFKYVDEFKICFILKCCAIAFLAVIIAFVSGIFNYLCLFKENGFYGIFFVGLPLLFMPFSFLMYKFFQFLTKKYPVPFEKIGYYSSIEFWRKTFSSFLGKFKVKSGK